MNVCVMCPSCFVLHFQVRNEFYRDSQGAILVFDVGNRASFESLDSWIVEMRTEVGDKNDCDNIVVCVCANKVRQP